VVWFGTLSRREQFFDVYADAVCSCVESKPRYFEDIIVRVPDYRYGEALAGGLVWILATHMTNEDLGFLRLIGPLWNPGRNTCRNLGIVAYI
jgi:hypothetical protein